MRLHGDAATAALQRKILNAPKPIRWLPCKKKTVGGLVAVKKSEIYSSLRIPGHMATGSDNIWPPVPGDVAALEVPLLSVGS